VGGTSNTFAFYYPGSTATRIIENNIFYNARSNGAGTGKHYAITDGGAGVNPAGLTSNYNDLFANGTGGVLGLYGAADQATLAAWQSVTGQDANSKSLQPTFVSTTNLHLSASGNCVLDGAGLTIGSVTNDFDNDTRTSTPDIGADEFTAITPSILAGSAGGGQVCRSFDVGSGATYTDNNCTAITAITPNGASPVSGTVNSCVTIDASVQSFGSHAYVQRHFDITPAVNQSTATARITLYVLQSEFDTYNANNGTELDLPTGSGDATGRANLRITKYSGNGTAPGNYSPGVATLVDPDDNTEIVWNAANSWWEISFDVTGFSGFFIHSDFGAPLPVTFVSFIGYREGGQNKLRWTTATESNNSGFEVQRSADGQNFTAIGFVISRSAGGNSNGDLSYDFTDHSATGGKQYYRIRQVDLDNRSRFSSTILIRGEKPSVLTVEGLFPSPANTFINIAISSPVRDRVMIAINDIAGQTVIRKMVNVEPGSNTIQVNISELKSALYIVKLVCSGNCEQASARFIKQ
jgi:hypothetical protein